MISKLLLASMVVATVARAAESVEPDIVGRYLSATREQHTALLGVSMEVDIDANVPKLKKQGELRALRKISQLGIVTYRMLGFNGDSSVKKDVIARYLSADVESQKGPNISITPENYRFKFKGVKSTDGNLVYVLGLTPRRKVQGLFKGELWLDRATCMPVREFGRFVKSPSIFLKRMEFVRVYELHNGISIPRDLTSSVNTRLFGPIQLSIHFAHFSKDTETDPLALASTTSEDRD